MGGAVLAEFFRLGDELVGVDDRRLVLFLVVAVEPGKDDADVDGAHIASLLITFFYRQMPKLIDNGHLFLAVPPLYRLSHGGKNFYARNDKHREAILKKEFHANAKVEVSRFKGLGEMMAAQLKETTMDPKRRTLLQVRVVDGERKATDKSVERLMGNKPEARFEFIQERAEFAADELLDV